MYWIEWMIWYMQTSSGERENWEETRKKYMTEKRSGKFSHEKVFPGIRESVSDMPCADGSVYECNEIYVEIMAGESSERRGVVTCFSVCLIYLLCNLAVDVVTDNKIILSALYDGQAVTRGDYASAAFITLLNAATFYVAFRYGRTLVNLENFVQRRMLIRFNRFTRQVYLHRPKFAGGITVLDWEQVTVDSAVGDNNEGANIGRKLILFWEPCMPDRPHLHLAFVGKRADGTGDIANLWEFIRRYMEEGPQSVPAPKKLLGTVPWPWLSVMASLSFFRPLWGAGLRWQVACIVALASPALALHAVGHWVSLLLCWEPRWPRIIREAGLPGKPVPALSTAADWPPLPKTQSAGKKPVRTRKPSKNDAEQDPQITKQNTSGPASGADQNGHRQELK